MAWDELWVEVKCQTNREIAGSPRNAFRGSLGELCLGGRALDGLGGKPLTKPNQTANAKALTPGVSLRGLIFVDERETTQTAG
jgi:hypothetical protein